MACRRIVEASKIALHRFSVPAYSTSVIPSHVYTGRNVQVPNHSFRLASTTVDVYEKPNIFIRTRKRLGFTEYPKAVYRSAAVFLYERIDNVSVDQFFKEFQLEDTFFSWFLVMELHFWILMSKASKYGKEGDCLKDTLAVTMWEDVRRRIKLIGNLAGSDFRKSVETLHDEMTYALVLYDKGIQTDDKLLTEAVWLRFYRGKPVDPQILERLVYYIRKQVLHIDLISKENFLVYGKATWLPLKECSL